MGFNVTFNEEGYRKALLGGACKPAGTMMPFIGVKPEAYYRFSQEYGSKGSVNLNLDVVKHHFDKRIFPRITGAIGVTLKHAATFFPTYRFLLKEILSDEWLAFSDWDRFHRDHIIHSPMCVYVGLSLLYGWDIGRSSTSSRTWIKFGGKTLLEHCLENLYNLLFGASEYGYLKSYLKEMNIPAVYRKDTPASRMLWKWIFLDTFFLATLFHDIGYPWKFVNDIQDKLLPFSPVKYYMDRGDEPDLLNSKRQNLSNHLKDYKKQLLFYPLNNYKTPDWEDQAFMDLVENTLRNTHGLSGALSLLYQHSILQNGARNGRNHAIHRFCVHWAAMAVMMHDMANIFNKLKGNKNNGKFRISPEKDPLSFILTLTDQIQDFARPDAVFKSNGGSTPKVTFRSRCSAVRLNFESKTDILKIIYIYKNPTDLIKARDKYLRENQTLYFDQNNGYLDYKPLSPNLRIILDVDRMKI